MNEYKFADLRIGMTESFDVTVDSRMLDSFIAISGDVNPLHTDSNHAKSKGFHDRVIHGLLTSAFYSTLVGMYLPGKFCILQGINIQFTKPVFLNDCLRITGKVNYINDAYKQIEIKAIIVNTQDVTVSKATIKIGIIDE